jgi:ankyrin repeat protein
MNMIKAILLTLAMTISTSALALTDEQHNRYTEALRDGDIKMVKQYLNEGVKIDEKFYTWEALQIAANSNQMEVVKLLVEKGADVNYAHPITHLTALHLAAFKSNKDMVKYLISKGADINALLRGDLTLVAALRDEDMNEMADFMLSLGAKE